MKRDKQILKELIDNIRTKQKITHFFINSMLLHVLIKKRLWREFFTRRKEWQLSLRKWFASRCIQHIIRDYQKKYSSESKKIKSALKKDPGIVPKKFEIQMSEWAYFNGLNTARYSFISIACSSIQVDKKCSKMMIVDFLKKAKNIKAIRESFFEFKKRLNKISTSIKDYLAVKDG